MGVFHFLKLYKWYQIAQNITLTVNGSMVGECKKFYSRLASLLPSKRGVKKSQVTTWIKPKINFAANYDIVFTAKPPQ